MAAHTRIAVEVRQASGHTRVALTDIARLALGVTRALWDDTLSPFATDLVAAALAIGGAARVDTGARAEYDKKKKYWNYELHEWLPESDFPRCHISGMPGMFNRKSFDRSMHRCYRLMNHDLRRAHEAENTACLAILDIDHFKKVNDTYGHLYGDEVLLHFAQQMQKIFRQDDGLFRYGGEEFIVILNDVDIDIAESVLNRFRKHIKAYPFPKVDKLTVSIGYTRLETGRMQSEIVDRADHALYFAKEHGRNNVACYEKLVDEGLLQELVTEDDIELF